MSARLSDVRTKPLQNYEVSVPHYCCLHHSAAPRKNGCGTWCDAHVICPNWYCHVNMKGLGRTSGRSPASTRSEAVEMQQAFPTQLQSTEALTLRGPGRRLGAVSLFLNGRLREWRPRTDRGGLSARRRGVHLLPAPHVGHNGHGVPGHVPKAHLSAGRVRVCVHRSPDCTAHEAVDLVFTMKFLDKFL